MTKSDGNYKNQQKSSLKWDGCLSGNMAATDRLPITESSHSTDIVTCQL